MASLVTTVPASGVASGVPISFAFPALATLP
jgi:hypothetical protein